MIVNETIYSVGKAYTQLTRHMSLSINDVDPALFVLPAMGTQPSSKQAHLARAALLMPNVFICFRKFRVGGGGKTGHLFTSHAYCIHRKERVDGNRQAVSRYSWSRECSLMYQNRL